MTRGTGSINQGFLIKKVREQAGLTQDEFADWFGVTQVTISNWESGHSSPKGYNLRLVEQFIRSPEIFKSLGKICRARLRGKEPPVYEFACGGRITASAFVTSCPFCSRPTDLIRWKDVRRHVKSG
ncbi:helix-turn-helix transcriptional regulator [Aerococcus urinae]|uniref:helix-turn-helix domain-containing protein n=1 Tax=Aerococcus urinae TaxID=1376 RepID=UPI00254BAA52|nr:helix-turn-helix transcriptional regulator [Aerococcus urinae]MDK6688290.1 helix-turn-helix transcriptional regulator [Aerococcus urinae]